MPTIADFGKYRICMYAGDHNPPHFHVVSPEFHVRVEISTLRVIDRGVRKRKFAKALDYADRCKAELALKWMELNERE
jgi:hypothetical protein